MTYRCNLYVTFRPPEPCLRLPESAGYQSPCRYTKNNTNLKWDVTKKGLEWSHETKFYLSFHCWVTDTSSDLYPISSLKELPRSRKILVLDGYTLFFFPCSDKTIIHYPAHNPGYKTALSLFAHSWPYLPSLASH